MDARTGFVTQLGMDPITAIERAGEYGFEYVEVMMDGPTERHRFAELREAILETLRTNHLDLCVHLPFGGIDVASPFEHVREGSVRELEAAIRTALECDAEKGVLHVQTGAWAPAWEHEDLQPLLFESIRELDAFGRERGFEICVENVPRGVFTLETFPALFDATEASMTFDTGHARIDGYDTERMVAFTAEHADRISHVHCNDTRQARDEHLPFGSGTIDFERLFDALGDDWVGTLSLEVFTRDFEYIETSKARLDALL